MFLENSGIWAWALEEELYFWLSLLVTQLLKNLRPGFEPWIGKSPWRRERLPTPVFWPREFHGLHSPWGCKELDTTERISLSLSLEGQEQGLEYKSWYFPGKGIAYLKTWSCEKNNTFRTVLAVQDYGWLIVQVHYGRQRESLEGNMGPDNEQPCALWQKLRC